MVKCERIEWGNAFVDDEGESMYYTLGVIANKSYVTLIRELTSAILVKR